MDKSVTGRRVQWPLGPLLIAVAGVLNHVMELISKTRSCEGVGTDSSLTTPLAYSLPLL